MDGDRVFEAGARRLLERRFHATEPGHEMTRDRGRARNRFASSDTPLLVLGAVLVAFLALPLFGLVTTTSWSDFLAGLDHPIVWPALRLSVFTTVASLVVVVLFGTPLAWLLARRQGRLARLLETTVQLPIVIPPAVAGVALLLAFGRRGLAGFLYPEGFSVAFTTAAVVMAEVFVSAPFFVQAATSAFRRIDENLLLVARSFGASPLRLFVRIGLPLAAPGLIAGAAMSWARALGEFGATLMFAGNLADETQTLPLAIYTALESDLRAAQALSLVLVAVAFGLLLSVRASLSAATPVTEEART
jgi:molybdate transport system permease protein